jgi:ABC-type multidrug transport system fused ATPase/permease subunit
VRKADLILVLKEGRVIERGSFDELARAGGHFAKLVAEGGLKTDSRSDAVPSLGPDLAA